ncbi:hypothetical protein VTI74DRAFT_4822 [Chaetomium olivicolor]
MIKGKCLHLRRKIGNSYAHIITDFMVFLLPNPFAAKLRLPKRQKIALMLVFCVGFFACLVSVIPIISLS